MNDFFNSGWSIFIAATTSLGLLGCLWLLWVASKRKQMADDNSTGHVFDEDLVEMNNPLPRWWMILFILTVVFAFVYVGLFGGLGSHTGLLNWSSEGQLKADQAAHAERLATVYAPFKKMSPEELAKDTRAMGIGERLFANNCATCHGSDAKGSKGFPNLTDQDWIHGGTSEKILESITEGRTGMMPPMGAALGSEDDVRNVAHYVLSLSGSKHDAAKAEQGKAKFVFCGACHGMDGTGNPLMGAPNLTDKVWLHGWGEAAIMDIVNHGKTNIMPPQKDRLTEDQIRILAAYVGSLSASAPAAAPAAAASEPATAASAP